MVRLSWRDQSQAGGAIGRTFSCTQYANRYANADNRRRTAVDRVAWQMLISSG